MHPIWADNVGYVKTTAPAILFASREKERKSERFYTTSVAEKIFPFPERIKPSEGEDYGGCRYSLVRERTMEVAEIA